MEKKQMLIEWQLILDADAQPENEDGYSEGQGENGNYGDIVLFSKLLEIEGRINELEVVKNYDLRLKKIKRMLNAVFLLLLFVMVVFVVYLLEL